MKYIFSLTTYLAITLFLTSLLYSNRHTIIIIIININIIMALWLSFLCDTTINIIPGFMVIISSYVIPPPTSSWLYGYHFYVIPPSTSSWLHGYHFHVISHHHHHGFMIIISSYVIPLPTSSSLHRYHFSVIPSSSISWLHGYHFHVISHFIYVRLT